MLESTIAKKVHLIALGCARNRVDAEVMLGGLIERGWAISPEAEGSDAVIVNTCGFIGPAKQESIDHILEVAALKKDHPNLKLVVSGCLTQRYKTQLAKGLPEVDLFIGTDEFPKLPELLETPPEKGTVFAKRTNYLYEGELPKLNTLSKRSAYVKVAEGCQHSCAFCIIPAIRGPLRSRPVASVVAEVERLVSQGVWEVNLIAQDLAAYGRDIGNTDLLELLRALVAIDGLKWIRLLYMYPENISDEFLEFFAREEKLVKYLDIPMQHGSDTILQKMNRGVTRSELESTIKHVRAKVPGIVIRTTVMVGFPGESEEDFAELSDFVAKMKFDHLGCFAYSREEGTFANRLPDHVDEAIKQDRLEEIMELQKSISAAKMQEMVGRTVSVLVEGLADETDLLYRGRMSTQAPEVDGHILLNDGPIKAGAIQNVRISEAFEYDLVGTVLS